MRAAIGFLMLGLGICGSASAMPSDPDHPGPYHKWFESQIIPEGDPQAGMSCCAESDGHIIEEDDWRISEGHYEIIIHGHWVSIPDSRVLPNSSNPTGKPVAWYIGMQIYCFAPGTAS
jgi:hypothetical protein